MSGPIPPAGGVARGALDGVRVLDLGGNVAAAFAARLLGDFGADVVRLESPHGMEATRRLPPFDPAAAGPERSLLFQYLNWNKRSVTLEADPLRSRETLRRWVEGSDVVFEGLPAADVQRLDATADRLLAWNPRTVVVSVTGFGRTGPCAGFAASDLVLQAMSGVMHISGRVDRPPLKPGLAQGAYCAGLNAAYAGIAALVAAERDGVGEHVDVSMQECLASELVMNQPYYTFMGAVQGRRAVAQDPFQGEPIPTRSGYLAVQSGPVRFERFADLFGREEFRTPEYAQRARRHARIAEVRAVLASCLAQRDAKDLFLEGARMRLLLGVVQGAPQLLQCEQLAARGAFAEVAGPAGTTWSFPAELAKLSATPTRVRRPAPRLGEHADAPAWPARIGPSAAGRARLPLAGLRVVDLSYVFAVPYMGALLSDLGADVVKVEGTHRLDQTRSGAFGPYLDNDPGPDPWNRSGAFHMLNRGKRSLLLDLGSEDGREVFRRMAARADFVLENYTPRVMRGWNLHYDALRALNPALIMLSNTGYGSTGPWRDFPSQGTTLEATMGIAQYTGYRGDKPWKAGQSYPDFLACWAGLAALLAALRHRQRTGEGQWIDLGMYQLGAAVIPEALLQWQLAGTEPARIGNEDERHVPSNLYPALGTDRWIAITVATDGQWRSLARHLELQDDPRLASEAGRRAHRGLVDAAVARWTGARDAWEATRLLQSEGIASGPVLNNRDLLLDAHLKARGFYEDVAHPLPVGLRPVIGRPYRMRHRALRIRGPAPRLGEGGHQALREAYGFSEEELAARRGAAAKGMPTASTVPGALDMAEALQSRTVVERDADYRQRLGIGPWQQETGT